MLRKTLLILTLVSAVVALLMLGMGVGHSQSSLRRLTTSSEQATNLNPTLSDNGLLVAFESTADLAPPGRANSFHSVRLDLNASSTTFLEVASTRSVSPSLSRDGSVMAFASNEDLVAQNADRNSEIYLYTASQLTQITHTRPDSIATRLTDGNFQPSISSDGRIIAFASNRYPGDLTLEKHSAILLFDVSSSKFTQIASGTAAQPVHDAKISGDGSYVSFLRGEPGGETDLMLYEATTSAITLQAAHLNKASVTLGRAMSDDGIRLVYSAEVATNQTQVFLFDRSAGTSRQVTSLGARISDVPLHPTISGDGKRIAFATRRKVRSESDGSVELYLLDLPTREIQQITNAPPTAIAEVVSSLNFDGTAVAFNFPRILSGPVEADEFANNSEIYLSQIPQRPAFATGTILNAASLGNDPNLTKTFSANTIVKMEGSALSATTMQAEPSASGQFPLVLGGSRAVVQGLPAEVLYVSPTEATIVLPSGLLPGPAEVVITNGDGFETRSSIVVGKAAPGLFTFSGDGRGMGLILNANTLMPSPFDPTTGDLRLAIFATGVQHATDVRARINGEQLNIESVLSLEFPGLDEIRLLIPSTWRGAGITTLSVNADGVESNEVTLEFSGSPLRDLLINEFLADPPIGPAGDANLDGIRSAGADEFIEIVNPTSRDLDVSNYGLFTKSATSTELERHEFALGTVIPAGTSCVVFGGGNPDALNDAFGGSQVFKATSGSLSLNNSAGAIIIRDSSGATVSSVNYGASTGLAAGQNQSLTRSPDIGGRFVPFHSAFGSEGKNFSPGTHIDGSPFFANPPLSKITISATGHDLIVGYELQFTATAFDRANNQIDLDHIIFRWRSSPTTVLAVNTHGQALGIEAGSAEVVASARGVSSAPFRIVVAGPSPSPSPSPIPRPSPTPNPTPSPSPAPVPSPTETPAPAPTPTPGVSPSPSPIPTATPTPTPSPLPTPLPSPSIMFDVVISEFRTRGPRGASDEFIELYNRSENAFSLSGWKIKGSSASGTIGIRVVIGAGTILPAHGHFLATNVGGYSGSVIGDQGYSNGLVNDGGLAVTLPDDTLVDQVGLGPSSAFQEGMHLAPLPADTNQSYERRPGGLNGSHQDTNDNFSDFQLRTPSDPQNLTSVATPGPTPMPSVTPAPTPTPMPSPSATPSASPSVLPTPLPSPSPTVSPTPDASPSPSPNVPTRVVINQIFGGGGNSGAPLRNDFIELFNAGTDAVNLAGWSIQYASATASSWSVTNLTPVTLLSGQHYLVQESSGGTNGGTLPAPDAIGTIALAATAGKVALVRTNTSLVGSCPTDSNIVDFVGYGGTANCFRGTGAAPSASNTRSLLRAVGGCATSNDNVADFVTGSPFPQNTASPSSPCFQRAEPRAIPDPRWSSLLAEWPSFWDVYLGHW